MGVLIEMKSYTLLDIGMIILSIFGLVYFYEDLASGTGSYMALGYFVAIAIAYIFGIEFLNERKRKVIKKFSAMAGCKHIEGGKLSLVHILECDDTRVDFHLRSAYTPEYMKIQFFGRYKPRDVRSEDKKSVKFAEALNRIANKYGLRLKDAYSSEKKASIIIKGVPSDAQVIKALLEDMKKYLQTLKEY